MSDCDETNASRKRAAPSPTGSVKSTMSTGKRSKFTRASPGSTSEKSSKGLRHFSMMVCKKVEEKGTTTYNEVADELVKKVVAERETEGKFDEKNIRRRVYDALNVLMAMDIISKDKKDITWRGLPTAESQDLEVVRDELEFRRSQLQQKKGALRELLVQQVCFRNLIWHNHQRRAEPQERIPLPFIVVNTNNAAVIQCDMSRDRTDVMFDISMPFEINDDNTILKKMGLDKTTMSVLRDMLPGDLVQFCEEHRLLEPVLAREQHTESRLPPPTPSASSQQPRQSRGPEYHGGPPMQHPYHSRHHQYQHPPPPHYFPQMQHPRGRGYNMQHHYGAYDSMGGAEVM